MADYLWSELLGQIPPELVAFLTRTAVLERMSGPLCDAVLDTTGSAQVLASLEESNLLLVPLDRQRRWYRYHHLFHELLLAELDRREPELVPELHGRAAGWCEANGLPETAIDHAQAAGDADRVARLVWKLAMPAYGAGRVDTTRRWFGWFEDQGLLGRYRSVAVLGAWLQALVGEPVAAERWADAAEHGPVAGTLPDGSTGQSYLALLRALLCRHGVDRMRADTQAALAELSPGSQWRPTAQLLEGIGSLLAGQADRADPVLAHAAEVATEAGALPAAAIALAERSVVAMGHQDWKQAATLAEQAQGVVRAGGLDGYVASALVHAVAARVAVHQGEVRQAQEQLARATRLRPLLTYALPYLAVQTLVELGRVCLAVDDAAGARVVLRQARDILRRRPDLGILPSQAEELRSKLDSSRGGAVGVSSLTTAELRLLPLLPTRLTLAGDRRTAVPLPAHGQDPGVLDLPQARRLLPQPGRPAPAGAWSRRVGLAVSGEGRDAPGCRRTAAGCRWWRRTAVSGRCRARPAGWPAAPPRSPESRAAAGSTCARSHRRPAVRSRKAATSPSKAPMSSW